MAGSFYGDGEGSGSFYQVASVTPPPPSGGWEEVTLTAADLGTPTDPRSLINTGPTDSGGEIGWTLATPLGATAIVTTTVTRYPLDVVTLFPAIDFSAAHIMELVFTPSAFVTPNGWVGLQVGNTATNAFGHGAYHDATNYKAAQMTSVAFSAGAGGQAVLGSTGPIGIKFDCNPFKGYTSQWSNWPQTGGAAETFSASAWGSYGSVALLVYNLTIGLNTVANLGTPTVQGSFLLRCTQMT